MIWLEMILPSSEATVNRGLLRMEMLVGVPGSEWVVWWGWGEFMTLELWKLLSFAEVGISGSLRSRKNA